MFHGGNILTQVEWASEAYWREFAPGLHVADMDFLNRFSPFGTEPATARELRRLVRKEGYFQLPPADWPLPLDTMARAVAALDRGGIPAPFAFVYDEFWAAAVLVHDIVEAILGPGFMRLPDFWAWHVDPARGDAGWTPHRDKGRRALRLDGSPKSLTVWLPLTQSTPLNGCIYVVPADRDPTYDTPEERDHRIDYPDIRALPAEPGAILGWNQAVLHWGSRTADRDAPPRISLAFEFQAGDVPPFNQPLMRPRDLPVFGARLKLIAKQILQYRHMYPLDPTMEAVAERLAP